MKRRKREKGRRRTTRKAKNLYEKKGFDIL